MPRRLACWSRIGVSFQSAKARATARVPSQTVLMPSTPFAYPQVVSRAFASFRVVSAAVPAGQRDFCAEFDSRQLHQRRPRSERQSRAWAFLRQQSTSTIAAPIFGHGSLRARGCKDGTTSSAKRPTDQSLEMASSLSRRNRQVMCRPQEQAIEPTSIRPGFSRWPLGQCSGGRTIQSP